MSKEERIVTIMRVEQDRTQRGRYVLHFDSGESLNVHEDVMIKYRLLKGADIAIDAIDDILRADEGNKAYVQALRHLQRKPRTRMEMIRHLSQKGYEEGIVLEAVSRLEDERLVDDRAYAEQWAYERTAMHAKGRRFIEQELKQKGVQEHHIAAALTSIDPEEERDGAQRAAAKKWRQTQGEPHMRKQKVIAFLLRRGYPMDLARRAAEEAAQEADAEDDF